MYRSYRDEEKEVNTGKERFEVPDKESTRVLRHGKGMLFCITSYTPTLSEKINLGR